VRDAASKIRDLEALLLRFAVDRGGQKVLLLPGDTLIIAEDRKRLLRVSDLVKSLWDFSNESL
jgi:hypothetical protein